ncbi:hypothetical protein [Pelagerythrobacter aerophilus]|nr:hypothetical protein [Pelagerythrobacter aerophilus]
MKWVFFLAVAILLTSACTEKPIPTQLEKYCVSDSGLSKYWLALNTAEREGDIRYQYLGQDIRYVVTAMRVEGREVSGKADFESSTTGETRGTPIMFSYDATANTFTDGPTSASCQNTQAYQPG